MTQTTNQSANLTWLLDDLVERVPTARQAVVLSADGLMMGASAGLKREDAEHLSAMAAGFQSLAKGASRHFKAGPVRQTVVEMEQGYLLLMSVGDGSHLAVLTEDSADIGQVGYEMALLVDRVGRMIQAQARVPANGVPG